MKTFRENSWKEWRKPLAMIHNQALFLLQCSDMLRWVISKLSKSVRIMIHGPALSALPSCQWRRHGAITGCREKYDPLGSDHQSMVKVSRQLQSRPSSGRERKGCNSKWKLQRNCLMFVIPLWYLKHNLQMHSDLKVTANKNSIHGRH